MDATSEKTAQRKNGRKESRGDDGRFLPGASGNPAGRPPRDLNRATMVIELALDARAEALAEKAIDMALDGDVLAMRLCLERLLPARRERRMTIELPAPAAAQDITAGFARVVQAIRQGELTPSEADSLGALLESARRAIETTDLAGRIQEIESQLEEKPEN
jgi:hypothetical protein